MTDGDLIKDLVIIGAGPSALAAAVYTTREDIDTTLYEKGVVGGLAAVTDRIDNYPGFPDGVEGIKLAEEFEAQARRFGAKIEYGDVTALHDSGEHKTLTIDGKDVKAKVVLIATGSEYNKIGAPGEDTFYGRGVHYCATCDGAFYRGKKIAVVGGGNSGVQEAIFLTKFVEHIDLLVRSELKASEVLQHELQKYVTSGQVTIHTDTQIVSIDAVVDEKTVDQVMIDTGGIRSQLAVDGVFIFVGLKPNTAFLKESGVTLDERGLIVTDHDLMTSVAGVFASGDVRSHATMQIASAVGEGATAALKIREYLDTTKV